MANSKKPTMRFKRGDDLTHTFKIPIASWSAGGKLFFAAKLNPDNDVTDALAVIDREFDDTFVSTLIDPLYATYTLPFSPSDITGVSFSSTETSITYAGEFQYVSVDGKVSSFPSTDTYIDVIIYADIKRGTT